VIFALVHSIPGLDVESFLSYVFQWILIIFVIFLLAKWYFRKALPTTKSGLYLGLITIGVGILVDVLFIIGILLQGGPLDTFIMMYSDWKFYATVALVLATCTYTGYEFDTTYIEIHKKKTSTNVEGSAKKLEE
jgi:hypothetical protein